MLSEATRTATPLVALPAMMFRSLPSFIAVAVDTDEVRRRTGKEACAGVLVGKAGDSGSVRADEIALDSIVGGSLPLNGHSSVFVSGDEVAGAGSSATDDVVRPLADVDSFCKVPQRGQAIRSCADVVALDSVVRRADDVHTMPAVPGEDVTVGFAWCLR